MGTLIQQKPLKSSLPVGQDVIFTVSNDSIVLNSDFIKIKFIAEVHISSDEQVNLSLTDNIVGTFKTTPNNAAVGIFNFRNIVENFVSADNMALENSNYKLITNENLIVPIHLINRFSRNSNSYRYMAVKFKVQYVDNLASSATFGDVITTGIKNSGSFKFFNGYLKYSDILETGTGSEINDFGYSLGNFFLTQNDRKFLTNAPLVQYANLEDYATTTIFLLNGLSNQFSGETGAFLAPNSGLYGIRFRFYEADGTEIITTPTSAGDILIPAVVPGYGGLWWADETKASNRILFCGIGPANLRGYSDQFNANIDNIAYYTYQAKRRQDTGGLLPTEVSISDEYTVYINCPTLKGYKPIRLTWLNQWGGWDYYTFTMKSTKKTSTKGTTYQQLEGTWNNSVYKMDGYKGGKKTFRVNATEKITMNSNFLTEEESNWFEELINSPEVYILEGFQEDETNPLLNNYVTPVRLTTKDFTTKTVANDKLIQYTFEVEKSKTLRTQSV